MILHRCVIADVFREDLEDTGKRNKRIKAVVERIPQPNKWQVCLHKYKVERLQLTRIWFVQMAQIRFKINCMNAKDREITTSTTVRETP